MFAICVVSYLSENSHVRVSMSCSILVTYQCLRCTCWVFLLNFPVIYFHQVLKLLVSLWPTNIISLECRVPLECNFFGSYYWNHYRAFRTNRYIGIMGMRKKKGTDLEWLLALEQYVLGPPFELSGHFLPSHTLVTYLFGRGIHIFWTLISGAVFVAGPETSFYPINLTTSPTTMFGVGITVICGAFSCWAAPSPLLFSLSSNWLEIPGVFIWESDPF